MMYLLVEGGVSIPWGSVKMIMMMMSVLLVFGLFIIFERKSAIPGFSPHSCHWRWIFNYCNGYVRLFQLVLHVVWAAFSSFIIGVGMRRAFINIFKMPATYAAIMAIIFHFGKVELATPIIDTVSIVGDAAIPVMMIVLGMQLGSITKLTAKWQVVISGILLKMFVAPLITIIFVSSVEMDPLMGTVLIIISAMQTAATTTM